MVRTSYKGANEGATRIYLITPHLRRASEARGITSDRSFPEGVEHLRKALKNSGFSDEPLEGTVRTLRKRHDQLVNPNLVLSDELVLHAIARDIGPPSLEGFLGGAESLEHCFRAFDLSEGLSYFIEMFTFNHAAPAFSSIGRLVVPWLVVRRTPQPLKTKDRNANNSLDFSLCSEREWRR